MKFTKIISGLTYIGMGLFALGMMSSSVFAQLGASAHGPKIDPWGGNEMLNGTKYTNNGYLYVEHNNPSYQEEFSAIVDCGGVDLQTGEPLGQSDITQCTVISYRNGITRGGTHNVYSPRAGNKNVWMTTTMTNGIVANNNRHEASVTYSHRALDGLSRTDSTEPPTTIKASIYMEGTIARSWCPLYNDTVGDKINGGQAGFCNGVDHGDDRRGQRIPTENRCMPYQKNKNHITIFSYVSGKGSGVYAPDGPLACGFAEDSPVDPDPDPDPDPGASCIPYNKNNSLHRNINTTRAFNTQEYAVALNAPTTMNLDMAIKKSVSSFYTISGAINTEQAPDLENPFLQVTIENLLPDSWQLVQYKRKLGNNNGYDSLFYGCEGESWVLPEGRNPLLPYLDPVGGLIEPGFSVPDYFPARNRDFKVSCNVCSVTEETQYYWDAGDRSGCGTSSCTGNYVVEGIHKGTYERGSDNLPGDYITLCEFPAPHGQSCIAGHAIEPLENGNESHYFYYYEGIAPNNSGTGTGRYDAINKPWVGIESTLHEAIFMDPQPGSCAGTTENQCTSEHPACSREYDGPSNETRDVVCRNDSGEEVDESNCDPNLKPTTTQSCEL